MSINLPRVIVPSHHLFLVLICWFLPKEICFVQDCACRRSTAFHFTSRYLREIAEWFLVGLRFLPSTYKVLIFRCDLSPFQLSPKFHWLVFFFHSIMWTSFRELFSYIWFLCYVHWQILLIVLRFVGLIFSPTLRGQIQRNLDQKLKFQIPYCHFYLSLQRNWCTLFWNLRVVFSESFS
jgi:hypothetical protein